MIWSAMSHVNEGFTGTESGTPDPTEPAPDYEQESRKTSFVDVLVNSDAKHFSPVVSEKKNSDDITGVFVINQEEIKKIPKEFHDDYLPHEYRHVEHPTTNLETLLHLLKGSLGTGILAMPLAFYHAGYAIGIGGTLFIGVICTYCIHMLIKAQYELCKRNKVPCYNFPDTAIMALKEGPKISRIIAPYAGVVINTFLLIYQLGTCTVYVIFVALNIKAVVDEYADPIDVKIYMAIILLPLILINWIRNLKLLAPFSTVANLLTFIGFGIILYYIFVDGITLEGKEPVGHLKNMPLFFGTVLFALEAIGVILPLENNMKTPKSFGGVFGILNQAMTMIITLYVMMGFFGYMKYGDQAEGSITLNLPKDEILAQCVKIMLALAIFTSHSLQCYVAIDITWNGYIGPKLSEHKYKTVIEFAVRTGLVIFTFLLAVAIPSIDLFISLFGAFCLSALGIAFPAIIQTVTFWYSVDDNHTFYAMLFKNIALVLFALIGLIAGTYTSIREIVAEFS